jgi:hypothetical protein
MMQTQFSIPRAFSAVAVFTFSICLALGCATSTSQPQSNVIDRARGDRPTVAQSGFLGDYSQLKAGEKDRAALVYINPLTKWSMYNSIIVEPVQFWSSGDTVPAADREVLASYFYNALRENLQKNFILTDKPGKGVMKLQVAITDATSATPILRSVSVIVPQARVLNTAQSLATGSYAFVGSAQAEGQITDSLTGERLAAAVDKREGGMSLSAAAQWKWGDAQNILDFWAQKLPQRIIDSQSK